MFNHDNDDRPQALADGRFTIVITIRKYESRMHPQITDTSIAI